MSARLMGALVLAVAALACTEQAPKTDPQADVAAINAIRDREAAMAATGNMDSLLTVYTSDVMFMPPNEPAVQGQEALRKWGDAMFGQMSVNIRYTNSDVTVSGDLGVDRYTAVFAGTPKAGGGPIEENIKGVHILKRQPDGSWRIAQDVWNANAPTPPSPPGPPGPPPPKR